MYLINKLIEFGTYAGRASSCNWGSQAEQVMELCIFIKLGAAPKVVCRIFYSFLLAAPKLKWCSILLSRFDTTMYALALVTGLLSLVCSSIAISDVFESLKGVPSGWKQLGTPSPDKRIHLQIALKKPNHDLFKKTLFAVSSPDHPKYGQYLTREDLKPC